MPARGCGKPYALVWNPIPLITWLMPFIGHLGVCSANGRTYDFAGPFTVNEDALLFGRPTRYLVLAPSEGRRAKKGAHGAPAAGAAHGSDAEALVAGAAAQAGAAPEAPGDGAAEAAEAAALWDQRLTRAASTYRMMTYNICGNNCHCFVAHFLNRLELQGGGWNMVNLAAMMFVKGRYTSLGAALYTWVPWLLLVSLGGFFGRLTFLYAYLGICAPLLAWFLLYTSCCWRDLEL